MDLDEKISQGLINWLAERGPNDWHEVANAYNWDRSIEPLLWIVSQSDCDRATVATLFWRSSPDNAIEHQTFEEAKKAYNTGGYQVVRAILERLESGGYSRAEIACEDRSFYTQEKWNDFAASKGFTIQLPNWLWSSWDGADLSKIRYTEGLPRPMVEWVWPTWPEGWGD